MDYFVKCKSFALIQYLFFAIFNIVLYEKRTGNNFRHRKIILGLAGNFERNFRRPETTFRPRQFAEKS